MIKNKILSTINFQKINMQLFKQGIPFSLILLKNIKIKNYSFNFLINIIKNNIIIINLF